VSLRFKRWRANGGLGSDQQGTDRAWIIERERVDGGDVNARMCKLWRSDSRYPGFISIRRHESGGVELSFDALRHGGKEPRAIEVVAPENVDKLILSLLEVRAGEWSE